MRVLVLGAYGLIGTHVSQALLTAGHAVTGMGRDVARARRRLPELRWHQVDIVNMSKAGQWAPFLAGEEAVVNCAGALQDGIRDDVAALQERAISALFDACAAQGVRIVVQVSALGASPRAATAFLRTKAAADAHLTSLDLDWVILRPGLVIAPSAYGATALLRALASFPFVIPLLGGAQRAQTVHVEDVAQAAVAAVEGRLPRRRLYELAEAHAHTLEDVLLALRAWLGFRAAPVLHVPTVLGLLLIKIGDGLRWLGWRAPLCSTAYRELEAGIVSARDDFGSMPIAALARTLGRIPATRQERWFARAWLLTPLLILTLSAVFIITGIVALAKWDAATGILRSQGAGRIVADIIVLTGSVLDIALGAAVLVQRLCARAAQGMIGLTLVYLGGATVLTPDLWTDPLGPLIKAIPILVLALSLLAQMEER